MGGQIVDASLVSAQRQRNTRAEKEAIKAGKTAEEIWLDHPNKAAQKDTDARWTVKITKPTDQRAARSASQLAIPVFGYKSHVLIDRRFGFIRTFSVTDAASHEGRLLRDLVSTQNTASDVWADTAYRSQANETWLAAKGRLSRIHHKKPKGKPMPRREPTPRSPPSAPGSSMP